MKITALVLSLLIAMAFVGNAFAVGPGKTLTWEDGKQGKVTFDGKIHADKGLKCGDCHTKIVPMKKGEIKMADINAGKFCGACHNGSKAFKAGDPANCAKCHKK